MVRKIIKIEQDLCNGCGICVAACHEGAIGMQNGKAVLLRDDYCDGLGNCLPTCPTGAIGFEEREAAAFDQAAVQENMEKAKAQPAPLACGCPGSHAKELKREHGGCETPQADGCGCGATQLRQWPVQIQLVPVQAAYFENANLLVAADCAAYAYGNFHGEFMKNKITVIGCPKLDDIDYSQKLAVIIRRNNLRSVTVVRMEVPCCGGIEHAVKKAMVESGKMIPWRVVTLSTDGKVLED